MKEKLIHIQNNYRRNSLQNYFRERRIRLLNYRQRQVINSQTLNPEYTQRQFNTWKHIVLHGVQQHQEEAYSAGHVLENSDNVDFQINITSIQSGEYYFNFLMDGAPYNYLEETVHLLGKLVHKLLRASLKLTYSEQNIKSEIIIKVLRQIHYYLLVGKDKYSNQKVPNFKNTSKTHKILNNILDYDDYRQLLKRSNVLITKQILNLQFQLCSNFMIYPNYQLIKYILTKIVTQDNLIISSKRDLKYDCDQCNEKIEELLMKFVLFFKRDQKNIRKLKNIHHLQVIYEFHSYIQYNLVNIFQFLRNCHQAFEYEHVNSNLYFILTLFTSILHKFKDSSTNEIWQQPHSLVLIKPSIIDLLYNITYEHSQKQYQQRQQDELILTIEESVFKIFRYIAQSQSMKHSNRRNIVYEIKEEWQITGDDRYILEMLNMIRAYLKEIKHEHQSQ